MPCSHHAGRTFLAKDLPPEVQSAVERFFRQFRTTLDDVRQDLTTALREGDLDPSTTSGVRVAVEEMIGDHTADIETVFREGIEDGIQAGRAVAARRHALDIAFDVVPERALRELDDWAVEASDEVTSRFSDEITSFIRTAHEEGLSIDDLTETLNDDLFDGRLQDWEARRVARTETISSSNAGSHTANEDAPGVVAEEWITELDGRQRDSHGEADGQIVAVDGTFLIGGAEARYPGDPQLPAEERINCRCSVVPVFRDELTDSEFAQIESGGRITRSAPTNRVGNYEPLVHRRSVLM